MKSAAPGRGTSRVEVTNVSPHGLWLFIGEREVFVSFKEFPWFQDASIRAISRVELPSAHHLHWPELDIDLAVDSIMRPERYPLVSRVQARKQQTNTVRRRVSEQRSTRPRPCS